MKKASITILLSILFLSSFAQKVTFFPNTGEVKVLNSAGDTLLNPFAGGMSTPMFSNIDLNFDGKNDLFVFDHKDSTIATYIYGSDGKYKYAPEYAAYFPSMVYWANLVDYNKDGLPDIFAYARGGGLEVYKNVSSNNTLKFKMVTSLLDAPNITCNCITPAPVYADQQNLLSYSDMDGDGDIDILGIDGSGRIIDMYKNRSHDLYVKYDSLNYEPTDLDWGGIREQPDTLSSANDSIHPPTIGLSYGVHCQKRKHAGANLTTIDADGDGDMDVLYSDINSARTILLINGKKEYKHPFDTIVKIDTGYLNAPCRYFPGAYYVDMDNDGVRDLILSPLQNRGIEEINNVVYYHNDGKDDFPKFVYKKSNLLQEDEIDLGAGAAPAFLDRNGDGIPEYLAIATKGNLKEPWYGISDRIVLFQNINTTLGKPVFKMVNNDWLSLSKKGYRNISPAFGDMDGDGMMDLLLGNTEGRLIYYHNIGTGTTDNFVHEVNGFIEDSIDVGSFSTPAIADVNSDGIADLVIGCISGKLSYYKGLDYQTVGAKKLLNYELVNSFFGYIITNDVTDTSSGDDAASAPVITDFNNDGKLDMICGSATGSLFLYMDIQTNPNGVFYPEDKFLYNSMTSLYQNTHFGKLIHPAVALLNNDNLPDIMVGNEKGGLNYYSSHSVISGNEPATNNKMDVKIYPNPANDVLNIFANGGIESYQFINLLGQTLISQENMNLKKNLSLDISSLPVGIYVLHLQDSKGKMANEKVIVGK